MKFSKKTISMSLAALALIIFTFWGYPQLTSYLQPKACVEEGGTWNEETLNCEKE